jgi:hypothetical protein
VDIRIVVVIIVVCFNAGIIEPNPIEEVHAVFGFVVSNALNDASRKVLAVQSMGAELAMDGNHSAGDDCLRMPRPTA